MEGNDTRCHGDSLSGMNPRALAIPIYEGDSLEANYLAKQAELRPVSPKVYQNLLISL